MKKNFYILPVKSSFKRPPILSFFSISIVQISVIVISILLDKLLNFDFFGNTLSLRISEDITNAVLIILFFTVLSFIFLKERIVRSSFLNKLYFNILAKKTYNIFYYCFATSIILVSVLISLEIIETTLASFILITTSVLSYLVFIKFITFNSKKLKAGYNILDDIKKSTFETRISSKNIEYTIHNLANGPKFVYFNIGTIDLLNRNLSKIEETKQKLNNLLTDNSKITESFKLFIMTLPPNSKKMFKKNDHLKSLIIRLDFQRKESEKYFDSLLLGFQEIFSRLSVMTEQEIKFFYLSLLRVSNKDNGLDLKNQTELEEVYANLKISKIQGKGLSLKSKLNGEIIEKKLSISSMYNIENVADLNEKDNMYKFEENPLASLLSKIYSEDKVAVLTFNRLNDNGIENEIGRRVADGVEHKFKDLKIVEKKLSSQKKNLMVKSYRFVEEITKYDTSSGHFTVKLDIIDYDFGKDTSQFSNLDTNTHLARQNYVQHSTLKNILEVSNSTLDHTFIGNEFLINGSDIFMLGMFSQDNSYEEGFKSIFLGYQYNVKKPEPILLNMGKYQMSNTKDPVSNGHAILIGDTGSGKTTLLKSILYQKLAFVNQQVIILDKENEYEYFGEHVKKILLNNYGRKDFEVVNYGPDFIDKNAINPLSIPVTAKILLGLKESKFSDNKISEYEKLLSRQVALLNDYFFTRIIGKIKEEISNQLKADIEQIIYQTYNYQIGSGQKSIVSLKKCFIDPPNLADFKAKLKLFLSKKDKKNIHEYEQLIIQNLEFLAKQLENNAELKKYFNTTNNITKLNDTINNSNLIIFNTKDLVTSWQKRLYLILLISYLENIIYDTDIVHTLNSKENKENKDDKFPNGKALIVDELHRYFDVKESEDFTLFITTFLKDAMLQGRKRNVELYVASQNLSFASSAYQKIKANAESIVNSASYRFIGGVSEQDRDFLTKDITDNTLKDKERLKTIPKKIWAYTEAKKQLVIVRVTPHEDVKDYLIK